MRILVTGGAGYIGSHTLRLLLERGYEAWAYDNLSLGHQAAVSQERLIIGDIADNELLDKVLEDCEINAVIHFAANAYIGESVKEPGKYYYNNVANTIRLMECLRSHGIWRFVLSSTCATFGIANNLPISEQHSQQPVNPYGRTKLVLEHALQDYVEAYNWGTAALRYFNAAGAHPNGDIGEDHNPETHLIPLAIQVALGQRPQLNIFGVDYPTEDGTCIRDFIHVMDLAEAHVRVLEHLKPGESLRYNLGNGKGYSVREVIQTVEQVTATSIPVKEMVRRKGDPPILYASSELIKQELGWEPKYSNLRDIIETAWLWHRNHPQGFRNAERKLSPVNS